MLRHIRRSDAFWPLSNRAIPLYLFEQKTEHATRYTAQRVHQIYPIKRWPDTNRNGWVLPHHQCNSRRGLEETGNFDALELTAFAESARGGRSTTFPPAWRDRRVEGPVGVQRGCKIMRDRQNLIFQKHGIIRCPKCASQSPIAPITSIFDCRRNMKLL